MKPVMTNTMKIDFGVLYEFPADPERAVFEIYTPDDGEADVTIGTPSFNTFLLGANKVWSPDVPIGSRILVRAVAGQIKIHTTQKAINGAVRYG